MRLQQLFEQYPDVAKPIIIKTQALRLGVRFEEAARQAFQTMDIAPKGYHLFSYDRTGAVVAQQKLPFYYKLKACDSGIQTRLSDNSPYVIDLVDGRFMFCEDGEALEEVSFLECPRYYKRRLADGTPMAAIVQGLPGTLFITLNKFCEYGRVGSVCLFCDLNAQLKAQKKGREAVVARKSLEQVAEVLQVAITEPRFRHIFITGGTILYPYKGKAELDFYCEHLRNIRQALGGAWYPSSFQIGALDDEGWKRVRETGVTCIQPNIEVWGKHLFEIVCPGKSKYVGYDNWIKRAISAVKIFGSWMVVPNFVTGVEMAKPFGFTSIDEAVKSTLDGFDYLMSHGVYPRMDIWCLEPGSALAKTNTEPAPLEYYLRIGKGHLELREKYGLPLPITMESRECYAIDTMCDWDYFHGRGPASKKQEEELLIDVGQGEPVPTRGWAG